MDIYHLVGALFLQFCIVILTKGRVQASWASKCFFLLMVFLQKCHKFPRFVIFIFIQFVSLAWHGSIPLPALRGWRITVEVVLFGISNSMKPYPAVFHAGSIL